MSGYEYNNYKPITIKTLVKVCKDLKGLDRKDAIKYGKEVGIGYNAIDSLRQLLGYSQNKKHLPLEMRNAIADEYREGGIGLHSLAKKHGISYNAVYCIMRSRGIDTDNPRKWRKRDELNLLHLKKKGLSFDEIGKAIGRNGRCVREKFRRMMNRTKKEGE